MNLKQVAFMAVFACCALAMTAGADTKDPPPNGETGTLELRYSGEDCLNAETCGEFQIEIWATAQDNGGSGIDITGAQFLLQWDSNCVDIGEANIEVGPDFISVPPQGAYQGYVQFREGELDFAVAAIMPPYPNTETLIAIVHLDPACESIDNCCTCLAFRDTGVGPLEGVLFNKVSILGGAIEYVPGENDELTLIPESGECQGPCFDLLPPELECPNDLEVEVDCMGTECGAYVDEADLQLLSKSDNVTAEGDLVVWYERGDGKDLTELFPIGGTEVCWYVEDECGNIASCCFYVYVAPVEPPVWLECPEYIHVYTEPGTCGGVWDGLQAVIDSLDSCGGTYTCVRSDGVDCSSDQFDLGCTTITLTAVDICDQEAVCEFEVCVDDGENPEITCPPDVSVSVDPGECSAVIDPAVIGQATCTDNCFDTDVYYYRSDDSNLTLNDPFPVGQTMITWICCDGDLYDSCRQYITVTDDEDPTILCDDIVDDAEEGQCSKTICLSETVTIDDNCCIDSIVYLVEGTPIEGSCYEFPTGVTNVCVQVTDCYGNMAECCFTVTVVDTVPPSWTFCPEGYEVTTDPGVCTALVAFEATAVDNCPGCDVTITYWLDGGTEITSPYEFPLGCTTVTAKAVDCAGNEAEPCIFDVCVDDEEPPVLDCPANITTNAAPGLCGLELAFDVGITDNCLMDCDPPYVTYYVDSQQISSPYFFPVGCTEVLAVGHDCHENQSTCTFQVCIEDNELPVIECPTDITTNAAEGVCFRNLCFDIPVEDNCCIEEITYWVDGMQIQKPCYEFPVGTTEFCMKVMDCHSNEAQCCFNVTVVDTQPPVLINVPDDLKWFAKLGEDFVWIPVEPSCKGEDCKTTPDRIYMPECMDNCNPCHECSPVAIMCDGQPPEWKDEGGVVYWKFPVGVTCLTWICTDDAGNISLPYDQSITVLHGFFAEIEFDNKPGPATYAAGVPYGEAYQGPIRFEMGDPSADERLSVIWDIAFDRNNGAAAMTLLPQEIAPASVNGMGMQELWIDVPFEEYMDGMSLEPVCCEPYYRGCGSNMPIAFGEYIDFAAKHDLFGLWRIVESVPVAESGPDPVLNAVHVQFTYDIDEDDSLTVGDYRNAVTDEQNGFIDIADWGIFAGTYFWQVGNDPELKPFGPAHTLCWGTWPCPMGYECIDPTAKEYQPNTDLNGDWYPDNGSQISAIMDGLILTQRLWRQGEQIWWDDENGGGGKTAASTPLRSIHVKELRALGVRNAAEVDLNNDHWITEEDIELFFQGTQPGDDDNGWQNTKPSKK